MQKKFIVHLVILVFLNLLIKPISIFMIDAEVQNRVGSAEYGMYFSILNFTYLFNILLDLGISNYNTKHIAQFPHLVKRYMDKMVPAKLVLFVLYSFIVLLVAFFIGYSKEQFQLVYFLILNQFLISIVLFFRSYFAGLLWFKIDILFSVLDKLILIFLAGYLLYFNAESVPIHVSDFVYAQTVSYAITALIALSLIAYKIGFPRFKWSMPFNRVLIKESLPYALLILLMMLYNRIDAVMIERILGGTAGDIQSGVYAQAFRLLDAFVMFAMLFSNLLYPLFSKFIKQGIDTRELLSLSFKLLFFFSLFASIATFLYPSEILHLIYDNDILLTVPTFTVLMFSFIPNCWVMLFGTLLTANGSLKWLNWIAGIGLILNGTLNLLLIPVFGALGAAITTLLTQTLVALVQILLVNRQVGLSLSIRKAAAYLVFILLLLATHACIPKNTSSISQLLLFCSAGAVGFLALSNLKVKDLKALFAK